MIVDKNKLLDLYNQDKTTKEISEYFQIGRSTVLKYLKQLGLKSKSKIGSNNTRQRKYICKHCGETDKNKFVDWCYTLCKSCNNIRSSKYVVQRKLDCIKYKGGKCSICGYNKYYGALEFHHLDPSQKDFTISNDHFKLQEAVEESKKCILLCSNCHKELHDNMWTIDELNLKEKEEVKPDGIN